MMDRDDRYSLRPDELHKQVKNIALRPSVDSREWLIEDQKLGFLAKRTCKKHSLPLPSRELADLARRKWIEPKPRDRGLGGGPVRA